MKTARLSPSERALARRIKETPVIDVFPIRDPDLARLSELLHRMSICHEDTPATRWAGEALRVLHAYVKKQTGN